jgi:hypothetical protein
MLTGISVAGWALKVDGALIFAARSASPSIIKGTNVSAMTINLTTLKGKDRGLLFLVLMSHPPARMLDKKNSKSPSLKPME